MKSQKLITAFLLILPGLSWAGFVTINVPEPDILPLLAVGGIGAVAVHYIVAAAVQYMRRKK